MLCPDYPDTRVCIVGLGYVGLTLAVAMADLGFEVVGVERLPEVRETIRAGRPHFSEVGLEAKLRRQLREGRLTVLPRLDRAAQAPVTIITVGTPVGPDKLTKLASITAVCDDLRRILEPGALVVLRSTVRVGVTRQVAKPLLDLAGVPYHLAFCPERTLEGRALEELRTLPQIVGGIDDASTLRAARLFNFLSPTIVRVSDVETAEMIKLINNTQRDLIFAFANEVAAATDALGISALEVIRGGGLGYPRGQLPVPGPVGGPCLEKDPHILAESLAAYGFTPMLALHGRSFNEGLPERVCEDIARLRRARGARGGPARIAILGLAFKGRPETSDLRGTLAVPLIAALRASFPAATLVGHDPVVEAADIAGLGIEPAASLEAAFRGTDIVVLQNNHPAFATMAVEDLADLMAPQGVIYDMWNQHEAPRLRLRVDVTYAGLGTLLGRDRAPAPIALADAA